MDEIRPVQALSSIAAAELVIVLAVHAVSSAAAQIIYCAGPGGLGERLGSEAEARDTAEAASGRPLSFQADGATFRLAREARRIDLAFLFDPMMAVHTSNVEPLPDRITAVCDALLPRQPLRFVLADDPGGGKTVMAGPFAPHSNFDFVVLI